MTVRIDTDDDDRVEGAERAAGGCGTDFRRSGLECILVSNGVYAHPFSN